MAGSGPYKLGASGCCLPCLMVQSAPEYKFNFEVLFYLSISILCLYFNFTRFQGEILYLLFHLSKISSNLTNTNIKILLTH